jgi:hypothetical protein
VRLRQSVSHSGWGREQLDQDRRIRDRGCVWYVQNVQNLVSLKLGWCAVSELPPTSVCPLPLLALPSSSQFSLPTYLGAKGTGSRTISVEGSQRTQHPQRLTHSSTRNERLRKGARVCVSVRMDTWTPSHPYGHSRCWPIA